MNLIQRWLDARSRARLERQCELVSRLRSLIATLSDRLDPKSQVWATENLENAEWEIAIDELWAEVDGGDLVLSTTERLELEALTNHPNVDRHILSTGNAHPAPGDIKRR
jgi:hypothetical protein